MGNFNREIAQLFRACLKKVFQTRSGSHRIPICLSAGFSADRRIFLFLFYPWTGFLIRISLRKRSFPAFFSCCRCAEVVTVGGVDAIYFVVGRHDRFRLGLFDCNFEAFQIDLTQGALGNDARYAAAVFFLIVAGVMFDGRSDAVLSLHTACESCCDDSDQNFDWIFSRPVLY